MNNTIQAIKIFFASFAGDLPGLFFMICWALMTLTMINAGIILPLIFNLKIIPKIKKRVGRELEYHSSMKSYVLLWKFLWPCVEISQYIVFKYLTKKTHINFDRLINSDMALKKVNYNINQSSRFEIVMSFITTVNVFISLISAFTGLIIAHYYNIH